LFGERGFCGEAGSGIFIHQIMKNIANAKNNRAENPIAIKISNVV
jgi:hypothetical protein